MSRKIFLLTVILVFSSVMPSMAEYVFLNDGSIIQGEVIKDTPSQVVVRDKDKKKLTIERKDIMRILYSELYLGKIYVQKTDGKNEICYMVDEDRESYTFRRNLYKPEEFTLKRDQVLFMARGNPSALEGEADTNSIELKWFPPYNAVKKYRLYIKGPDNADFIVAGETGSRSYEVEDLKSHTKYQFYVTAIDEAGDESLPSNEFTITTLNIKPERPVKLRCEKRTVKEKVKTKGKTKGKTEEREVAKEFVTWDPAVDPDGTIKSYNVYIKRDEGDEKIATVTATEFELTAGLSVYNLRITAVDDLNGESGSSRVIHPGALKFGAEPVYLIPAGGLADMFGPGNGVLLYMDYRNLLFEGFEPGVSCGVIYLPGDGSGRFDSMVMVPVTLDFGYHLDFTEGFSVMPCISIGYTYMDFKYNAYHEDRSRAAFEPLMRAGALLDLEFENWHVAAGGAWGFILESSGIKPFYEIDLRFGLLIDM